MKLRISLPKLVLILLVTSVVTILGINLFSGPEKEVTRPIKHDYGVDDPQFIRTMGVLLGPALVEGNRVDTLLNGEQIFPAMLAAIRAAQQTITFETYIYWSGEVGQEFADALSERAKGGVKVHILVDWLGSQKMDAKLLAEMKSSGVQIEKYHPINWYTLDRLNNRTHRKILVVDGRVGFTGGVGIADEWNGHAQDPDHWRDTHYRLEGPAVAQMQAAFTDNWTKVSGRVLHGEAYFPPLKPVGSLFAQMFKSSSDGGADSTQIMYLLSIAAATHSIDLSMAYFVPDAIALETIVAALKRGVKVRILMPGPYTDASMVRRASRSTWGAILKAGAEMYEFQPTMFHCKILVIDNLWTSVGSTNFDSRSFRLNDEANLNVHDRAFAERQRADFESDLKRAKRITYEQWAQRPIGEKVWEHFLGLFGAQL
jgi:cardiolipin synthase A/B